MWTDSNSYIGIFMDVQYLRRRVGYLRWSQTHTYTYKHKMYCVMHHFPPILGLVDPESV